MTAAPSTLVSRTVTLMQDTVDAFADLTQDHQWIHTDPIRSAHTVFGGTIVHGMLVASMVPTLVGDAIDGHGEIAEFLSTATTPVSVINLGFGRLDFAAPVPTGTSVHVEVPCVDVTASADRLDVVAEFVVWAQLRRPRIAAAGHSRLRYNR